MQNTTWNLNVGALGMGISLAIKNQHRELHEYQRKSECPDSMHWQQYRYSPRCNILCFHPFRNLVFRSSPLYSITALPIISPQLHHLDFQFTYVFKIRFQTFRQVRWCYKTLSCLQDSIFQRQVLWDTSPVNCFLNKVCKQLQLPHFWNMVMHLSITDSAAAAAKSLQSF